MLRLNGREGGAQTEQGTELASMSNQPVKCRRRLSPPVGEPEGEIRNRYFSCGRTELLSWEAPKKSPKIKYMRRRNGRKGNSKHVSSAGD